MRCEHAEAMTPAPEDVGLVPAPLLDCDEKASTLVVWWEGARRFSSPRCPGHRDALLTRLAADQAAGRLWSLSESRI